MVAMAYRCVLPMIWSRMRVKGGDAIQVSKAGGLAPGPHRGAGVSHEEKVMHRGSVRAVLLVALVCVAVAGGCGPSIQYVSLSYQPTLEEAALPERGPTLLSIPPIADAREGMAPNIIGYLDQRSAEKERILVLEGDASLAQEMTEEIANLYRLYGFEVVSDSASAEAPIDGELRGEIVNFVVNTTKGGLLGEVEGGGAVNLQLWHPKRGEPLWIATLKASAVRNYQWSLKRARSEAADDIYGQLLRGIERSIPNVEERIKKFYETGR